MGTRADFYMGRGDQAEWLGSIAWDGYKEGIPDSILLAPNEVDFRQAVTEFIASRKDGTSPEMGWPWPWDDSHTTDCFYAWDDGVQCGSWGTWLTDAERESEDENAGTPGVFPNMKDRKNTTFGPRSGVLVFGA